MLVSVCCSPAADGNSPEERCGFIKPPFHCSFMSAEGEIQTLIHILVSRVNLDWTNVVLRLIVNSSPVCFIVFAAVLSGHRL